MRKPAYEIRDQADVAKELVLLCNPTYTENSPYRPNASHVIRILGEFGEPAKVLRDRCLSCVEDRKSTCSIAMKEIDDLAGYVITH